LGWPGHRAALAFFALVIGAWLVTMAVLMRQASLPPTASGKMLVVFEPGLSNDEVFARVTSAGARPISGPVPSPSSGSYPATAKG
jgi:hypothetical protein